MGSRHNSWISWIVWFVSRPHSWTEWAVDSALASVIAIVWSFSSPSGAYFAPFFLAGFVVGSGLRVLIKSKGRPDA
jgi:hypothetical protein